ncbi:MAG: CocE/NonD family hydrolase [Acidimicrobiia bacterium]|nr:CocE/NonD family hydrolase [Acidimicrobiia bacterium]
MAERGGLAPARLTEIVRRFEGEGTDTLEVRGDVGSTAWISCAGRLPWGQPLDQRPDEAHSLVYTWEPEASEVEILGHPRLSLRLVSSSPVVFLSAKLCDVFPDGTSVLVSRGLLNLAHRDSSVTPRPLDPGATYEVDVDLDATSWVFEAGHRLRLAIAGADWPNIWPPPSSAELSVDRSGIGLTLPVIPDGLDAHRAVPVFAAAPSDGDPHSADSGVVAPVTWRIEHDVIPRETRAVIAHGSEYRAEHGADVRESYSGTVAVSTDDPGDATATATARSRSSGPAMR